MRAPGFVVVSDEEEPCPYLPGETSRLPLRLPLARVEGEAFDDLLEEGDRRAGPFLYRTACASCAACEPIRIDTGTYEPSRSQAKVWRRNEGTIEVAVGAPRVTGRHLEIFNRHKLERGLGEEATDAAGYVKQFLESCTDTLEVGYLLDGKLIAVSILDVGRTAVSSVYHFFDPDESKRSLGVYSVMKEIQLCRELGLQWYYLGLYVAGCRSLRYKADYHPHQRKQGGRWIEYPQPVMSRPPSSP